MRLTKQIRFICWRSTTELLGHIYSRMIEILIYFNVQEYGKFRNLQYILFV